jgi:5-methylcytosine-specific restriction endonuclease McrA
MTSKTRKRHRPWSSQEQVLAEVAAASGCSLSQIAKFLNRAPIGVSRRLNAKQAERARETDRLWKKLNKERSREISRQWKRNNPERRKAADKRWRQENIQTYKEKHRRRRARQRNAITKDCEPVTAQIVEKLLDYFGNACAYCGDKEYLSIDHVTPLAKGGLHTPSNLLPACRRCNCSKCDNDVQTWYLDKEYFSDERWSKIIEYHPWLENESGQPDGRQ